MTELPSLNESLLDQVMDHIEKLAAVGRVGLGATRTGEDAWSQAVYRNAFEGVAGCGTAMCFAGWTAHLAGGRWAACAGDPDSFALSWLEREPDEPDNYDSRGTHAHERARWLLGLTRDESRVLFRACNDLAELRRVVAWIKSSRHAQEEDR